MREAATMQRFVVWFDEVGRGDIARVGGKNASIGEMTRNLVSKDIRVPPGFATTSQAYRDYIDANGFKGRMEGHFDEMAAGNASLAETGHAIRSLLLEGEWPPDLEAAILSAYHELSRRVGKKDVDVAVRSSATAEDLPEASFAGQQESFLNVRGEEALLRACRRCYASLFTDRAISYRQNQKIDHMAVALSIGVQQMVRSDLGSAGVMFSLDTETGFDKVVVINAAWGLGENVVQGAVDPDEYAVFKPLLSNPSLTPIIGKTLGNKTQKMIYASHDNATCNVPTSDDERAAFVLDDPEILTLSRWATIIEAHYGCPMDMEWAKNGETGEIFIVQARPETVQSRASNVISRTFRITEKGQTLTSGLAIGSAIATGRVCLIDSPRDIDKFVEKSVLVTRTTDPDWVPIMKKATAIITDRGGRTSHAAIVSRELGLPAIVGTGNATDVLRPDQAITVSCAEGDQGFVYDGEARFETSVIDASELPRTRTHIMLNLANPDAALRWWRLPADGVGLARMEFVIANQIRIHPMALVRYDDLKNEADKQEIARLTSGYGDKTEYFVDRLSRALGKIAATFHPKPVIVRMSDFKTNEYASLVGGAEFEPAEENPMIGFRGASRYYSPRYREGFALECRAVKRLREQMGFANVIVMLPFCRSTAEADRVQEVMRQNGLRRGDNALQVYVMCEIPSNVVLAREFAERFDGFSIGSNDLTQLTLGVDRDAGDLAGLFDEQDPAVRWMIAHVIDAARDSGAKIGLCGQAPSDHPQFAAFLVECGIDSISVSPDSFVAVKKQVAAAEAEPPGR